MICFNAYSLKEYVYGVPYENQSANIKLKDIVHYNNRIYHYFNTVNKFHYLFYCVKDHKLSHSKRAMLSQLYPYAFKFLLREKIRFWLETEYDKRNTIVFRGIVNTGKSLMANSIGFFFKTNYMSSNEQESAFFFSQLHGYSLAVMEEPSIIPLICDDYKKVMAGQPLSCCRKGENERITINKIPLLITTNNEYLGKGMLTKEEEFILSQRCTYVVFPNAVSTPGEYLSPWDVMKYIFEN